MALHATLVNGDRFRGPYRGTHCIGAAKHRRGAHWVFGPSGIGNRRELRLLFMLRGYLCCSCRGEKIWCARWRAHFTWPVWIRTNHPRRPEECVSSSGGGDHGSAGVVVNVDHPPVSGSSVPVGLDEFVVERLHQNHVVQCGDAAVPPGFQVMGLAASVES